MNNKIKKIRVFFREINFKTIYFNFKYLPFKQAIHLPIFVSRYVYLMETNGKIIINVPIKTQLIKIGYKEIGIFDHKRSRSIWQVAGKVIFNGNASLGHGSKLSVGQDAKLILGENFVISAESTIVASKNTIEFGSNCLLSWDTLIMDSDSHKIYNESNEQINKSENIFIGNHVWIGCRCLILKGSIIPDNTIIAANSLISKSLNGENKIFGGQPAKELKSGVTWTV